MQELSISGVENSTVVAVNDDGDEFRVPIDEATLARLRRSNSSSEVRVSPRDIQAQLRQGLSTSEVAALTGATVEHIERYAGPIVAERDYIVTTAQATPAFASNDFTEEETSFGSLILSRLDIVEARNSAWTAWKDESGTWIVKLTFTVSDVERDARWEFDPKRSHLAASNDEARRLSSAGEFEVQGATALRAVSRPVAVEDLPASELPPLVDVDAEPPATEDILEALRRRRRQNEDAPTWLKEDMSARTAPVEELFEDSLDIPLDNFENDGFDDNQDLGASGEVFPMSNTGSQRRKRSAMPSWNEIVSDTHTDDDLI